jgi:hypothetical protein
MKAQEGKTQVHTIKQVGLETYLAEQIKKDGYPAEPGDEPPTLPRSEEFYPHVHRSVVPFFHNHHALSIPAVE